jgi:hypothetical protein
MGLFCLFIPFSIIGLWMRAFNLGDNQADRVSIFNNFFPDFLRGKYSTTLLSIAFCIAAIFLSIICLKLSEKLWKFLNIAVLVISISLFLLNLFSMM